MVRKFNIFYYQLRHADVVFPCLQIIVFTIEDRHLTTCLRVSKAYEATSL